VRRLLRRLAEPGCYVDQVAVRLDGVTGTTYIKHSPLSR
jgi:hypothetical protein